MTTTTSPAFLLAHSGWRTEQTEQMRLVQEALRGEYFERHRGRPVLERLSDFVRGRLRWIRNESPPAPVR